MIFPKYLAGWFVVVVIAGSCVAGEPRPPMLRDVETWGDLLAQQAGRLEELGSAGVVSYRLGIDRRDGKLYGGVVLYCLLEGAHLPADMTATSDKVLGPFSIKLRKPGELGLAKIRMARSTGTRVSGSDVLYLTTIPLCDPGVYRIEVQREGGTGDSAMVETVAATSVEASGSSGEDWTPWPGRGRGDYVEGSDGTKASTGEGSYVQMNVENALTGVAVPKWDGWWEIMVAERWSAKMRLPRLLPQEPDPGVWLAVKGGVLDVKMSEGIDPHFPDDRFLSRWWVNGKLIAPKLGRSQEDLMRYNGAMKSEVTKEVRFHVGFLPDVAGVKKGDKVGVQVLLCPGGWVYSGSGVASEWDEARMQQQPEGGDVRIARASNRVDFVYSGDPAAMAEGGK